LCISSLSSRPWQFTSESHRFPNPCGYGPRVCTGTGMGQKSLTLCKPVPVGQVLRVSQHDRKALKCSLLCSMAIRRVKAKPAQCVVPANGAADVVHRQRACEESHGFCVHFGNRLGELLSVVTPIWECGIVVVGPRASVDEASKSAFAGCERASRRCCAKD